MVKAQDWLEQNYPRKIRNNISNLDISNRNLEGDLIVERFYNLKSFSCPYNKISSISIRDCKDIEIIDCGFNLLKEIELPDSNKIRVLMLHNNNLSRRSLSLFGSFINLETLRVGNELPKEKNNDFFGSLRYLRYLKNLKRLDIQSTNIDSGLEYLPENIEEIWCSLRGDYSKGVKRIFDSLRIFPKVVNGIDSAVEIFDYKLWRENNKELVDKAKSEFSAQYWLDKKYPVGRRNSITEINLRDYDDGLDEEKLLEGSLVIENFPNLKKVNLSWNNLSSLKFINCPNIEEINCSHSGIVDLSFAQNLNKLTKLQTTIERGITGLEYLPLSLREFHCNDGKIREELAYYGNNLALWQAAHPNLLERIGKKVSSSNYNYSKSKLLTVINLPNYLEENISKNKNEKTEVNYNLSNLNFSKFLLRDNNPFSWEISQFSSSKELPTRLYNITKGKNKQQINDRQTLNQDVELTIPKSGESFVVNPHIQRYVGMSYVCGTLKSEGEIYANARKALNKVMSALELINQGKSEEQINHVWIDQLCILQEGEIGRKDKKNEIPKMRNYYNNSLSTLVAIDEEIGRLDENDKILMTKTIISKIVDSQWFTRSWCFQEGLLSKQIIFMFDDFLVDGRVLANYWGSFGQGYSFATNLISTYITPLGWSHIYNPDHLKENIRLSIGQSLHGVANRQQTVSIDGIYSILGLLPYEIEAEKVRYQPRFCPECPEKKETEDCCHDEEKKTWHFYTKEELKDALLEVVNAAEEKGFFNEQLSWSGSRNCNGDKLWWVPEVNKDGSTSVEGLIKSSSYQQNGLKVNENSVNLRGRKSISDNAVLVRIFRENDDEDSLNISMPLEESEAVKMYESCGFKDDFPVLVDMKNKVSIEGKEAIEAYQNQLTNLELKKNQEKALNINSEREIRNFWANLEVCPKRYEKGKKVVQTFDNKIIYSSEKKYYVFDDNIAKQIINRKNKNEWEYLIENVAEESESQLENKVEFSAI
ncbi:MAG: hypothetical protein mread185_000347 [Mycoplasmataceae bacterium]|nr:MAG: hypothetical protein mread185_000347 [Mycoplasmataceae bacterium]